MSRSVLNRLRQEIVRARATLELFAASSRHKGSSVTAFRETAVADDDLCSDVRGKATSSCPFTSVDQAGGFKSRARAGEHPHLVQRRSPHTSVAQDMSPETGHTQHVTSTVMHDTAGSKAQSATGCPPHLAFDTARPFSEMPGPFSLPIIGTLWMQMPGGPLHGLLFEEKLVHLHEMYGPIIREKMVLGCTIVHVYKPEDIEAVYRAEGNHPKRGAFRMLHKYNNLFSDGVHGILSSEGDAWHRLRSKAQVKMLKPKSASAYVGLHNSLANDFVATIHRLRDKDGVIDDLLPHLYKFAMEGIGCVCFNRRLGAMQENISADSDTFRFIEAVNDVMEATHSEMTKFFISRWDPTFKKLVRAQSFIKKLSIQEVERTLEIFSRSDQGDEDEQGGDLIPYLMTKTDLTEQEVITIISEFFFAGVDTTSVFLGYALYALSMNPEVQDKLMQEIDQLVDGSDVVSASLLGRMSYLKAFTKETCRVSPVTPGNGRTLLTDIVLSGYHVPAGVIAGLHHDWAGKSEQYVKEPERFMPERWLRGNTSAHANIHPFIVMPFGFGPRSCVGRRFAEQELFLALIKILQKYRVEYAHDQELKVDMCLVNKPITPFKFRFVPRK